MTYYSPADSSKTKCCKGTRHGFYHFGGFMVGVALILCLIGVFTQKIFFARIFDLHQMLRFEVVNINVGLYTSSASYMFGKGNNWIPLEHSIDMSTFIRWAVARIMGIIAMVAMAIVLFLHLFGCCKTNISHHRWILILIEIISLFVALATLMCAIGLCESQIYRVSDEGDKPLYRVLQLNNLLPSKEQLQLSSSDDDDHEYDLNVSRPAYSFWILAATEMCLLLALVCSLPHLAVKLKASKSKNADDNDGTITNHGYVPAQKL